jgi:hypothetical protein
MKFRKKPVVIEAFQFTIRNMQDIPEWLMDSLNQNTIKVVDDPLGPYLLINTLEGTMKADQKDWIIKGVNGEIYPCKPEIFEKTYDKVNESDDTWKGRLKQETLDLAGNVNKLQDYMRTLGFYNLPRIDKNLLYEQLQHMMSYLQVLGARCELYSISIKEVCDEKEDNKPNTYPSITAAAGKLHT